MPKIYMNYFIKVISLTKTCPELEWRVACSSNRKVILFREFFFSNLFFIHIQIRINAYLHICINAKFFLHAFVCLANCSLTKNFANTFISCIL